MIVYSLDYVIESCLVSSVRTVVGGSSYARVWIV